MSRKGQRAPQLYQEGSYTKRRGRIQNTGKLYQSAIHNTAYQPAPIPEPPPVSHRHYGDQHDLDPMLPTEEDVRRSYGKVVIVLISFLNLT
jgi:hypothetical protein